MRQSFLILIPGFAKNEADTTCIPFSQSLIKTINKQYPEVEVTVIALDYPLISKEYTWFGNRVIPLNGSKHTFRPLAWLRLYRLLRTLSKKDKLLGILNLWCADNALVTHYFSKRNHAKQFTWLQGQDARKGNKALLFFKPQGKYLIVLSDFLKQEFQKNYSISPAYTIYPGVDPAMCDQQGANKKDIDIIGAGSLTSLKQYHIFIDVVEAIRKMYPSIKTMIVGKGPEEAKLRQIIIEKKLENNIDLKEELQHEQTLQLMARSKILLHPSSYEGYGMVCLEGLAAGCQVVSFVSPETIPVTHWNIVTTKEEMITKCLDILSLPEGTFYPVVPHTMEDCTNELMKLYHYSNKERIPAHSETLITE